MEAALDEIIASSADPEGGQHQFECLLETLQQSGSPTPPLDSPGFRVLVHLFGNAPAFGYFLITHPEEIGDLVARLEGIGQTSSGIDPSINLETRLRLMRMREWTIACAQLLAGQLHSAELGERLSRSAETIIRIATTEGGTSTHLAVIALGKLGAADLNVSSDVDLVFVHDEADPLSGLAAQQAEKLVAVLSSHGPEGFVFRVDMSLRPGGSKGPLVSSLEGLEDYYEVYGEDWERLALIRARPIAGDPAVGQSFADTVFPFVWRRSLDAVALEKLKQLKARSEARSEGRCHLKLGAGGIREIELTVQILQLIYGGRGGRGGRDRVLRTSHLLTAIQGLQANRILPAQDATALKEAYLFMRHAENCLQMEHDQQSYLLPLGTVGRESLAIRMRLPGQTRMEKRLQLEAELDQHSRRVREIYSRILPDIK